MQDLALARMNMVKGQVRTNRVTDPRVVAALSEVPRERFVPRALRGIAYIDEDLEIAPGRYMVEPMVLARMLHELALTGDELALEIGAARGYGTALLARLCNTVIGIEEDPELAEKASAMLTETGADNAAIVEGPLTAGYAKQGPYDVILFEGAVAEIPQGIRDQLAEGGRMAAVVIDENGVGRATIHLKTAGTVSSRIMFDAATPVLPGFERQPGFVF